MKSERRDLIRYRLSRASETFEEALLLLRAGHTNSAMSRLYYACFYGVTALLATEDLGSSKHSGVRALFNQHWVKPGRVSKQLGELYGLLFDRRQKGDYTDFVRFPPSEVESLIEEVRDFLEQVQRIAEGLLAEVDDRSG